MAPSIAPGDLSTALAAVASRADAMAARLADAATTTTTLARERALLRLIGVGGIDREGRPLAAEVVDRYVGEDRSRLAGGIGLPFAVALLEYEATPQSLALDVASGAIDLRLEAQLLADPSRRAAAADHLATLVTAAVARIDANRVARRDSLLVLGDGPEPWIGATLHEGPIETARAETVVLARAGLDIVHVRVPAGRELAVRLRDRGHDIAWHPRAVGVTEEPEPAGSQRGIAKLRDTLDEAAAERGAYLRLAVIPAALASPEAAIVAAFERVDVLELDPMAEIVTIGVHPERALADFAAAVRIARRAEFAILVGAGPPVVAPDLDAGVNSDAPARSGRALALQLLTIAIARRLGLQGEQVIADALPAWVMGETDPAARAAADVALRRALLDDARLAFTEPPGDAAAVWPSIVAAVQPGDGVALVSRRTNAGTGAVAQIAGRARAAAEAARELDAALSARTLRGVGLEHAAGALAAARGLLDTLADEGWGPLTGAATTGWGGIAADSVATMAPDEDPLAAALG